MAEQITEFLSGFRRTIKGYDRCLEAIRHRCGLSHYLLDAIRAKMELDNKTDQEAYSLSWFAGALYGFVDEWMRRGMVTSPDELEAMSRENSG